MHTLSEALTREMEHLLARADVRAHRIGEARASRWSEAPVDVLAALPRDRYQLVGCLRLTGTTQYATAIVYERPPTEPAPTLGSMSRGSSALIARARELGADAIVIHGIAADEPRCS